MALTQIDCELIELCLQRKAAAWQAFVERFAPLFVHVIRHTADHRSVTLSQADLDDIAAEIFTAIVANNFQILRHFRQKSSLATYLSVVARRLAVREIAARARQNGTLPAGHSPSTPSPEFELENRDLVEHLIAQLPTQEAHIVKAYHLDGKSYREISATLGIPENSIGPVLSRAREQLRRTGTITG